MRTVYHAERKSATEHAGELSLGEGRWRKAVVQESKGGSCVADNTA